MATRKVYLTIAAFKVDIDKDVPCADSARFDSSGLMIHARHNLNLGSGGKIAPVFGFGGRQCPAYLGAGSILHGSYDSPFP